MFGLTTLGAIHTAISLVAVVSGAIALIRWREIRAASTLGRVYLITTVLTCLTGFGIFQHGGFGKPHVLGVVTLIVLAIGWVAGRGVFGRASRYVETACYSTSFFFHMIPGVTETGTRLPQGAPWFASPEDPALARIIGAVALVFLIGLIAQWWRLYRGAAPQAATASR